MKHRQSDTQSLETGDLKTLLTLPRPVYGHVLGLSNRAISQRHTHAWAQLSYATQGVIEVATGTGRFIAPPLCAVWVPAGTPHGVRCSSNTEIRSLYIAPTAITRPWTQCRVVAVTPLLRELIRAFSELPVEYDEHGENGRLVQVLLDQLAGAPEIGLALPWPADARLRKICADIQAHPDSYRSLGYYSKKLKLSERTLSRLFLQHTGLSFRLWRQRSRLLSSLPLLEQGNRVTDVALACGYDSMSAFIAAFRDQMGATPRDFFRLAR
jgi:AraC-like DNA-binding protein